MPTILKNTVTAEHLQRAFGIGSRTTSGGIFKEYGDAAPGNLVYSTSVRGYVQSETFEPCFSQGNLDEYLSLMTRHATLNPSFAGLKDVPAPTESVFIPHRSVLPEVLRKVVQATQTRSRLEVFYRSLSSPNGEERIIAPHTLVYSGQRWHVRAWCEKRRAFRDFVLTRMAPGAELLGEALEGADPVLDANWQNQILVRLGPNPGLSQEQQRLVALDYGMDREQELKVPVRRALAHYLLQSLNVSWGGGSSAKEQPLVVVNPEDVEPYVFAD